MDPASIGLPSTISKAFGAIKKGFQWSKLRLGEIGRWMSAMSDVDNAEKTTKNPSALQKLFKGKELEASAIEALLQRKN